jgi:U6 snRNA-associated Sm-like protein LSm2
MDEQSAVKNIFIRGSVVRYVHLPADAIDTALLEDASRRGKLWLFQIPVNANTIQ